ncbi:MAG: nickel-dependent hydrogenase large subunit [Propionibacteriaceae bacterium]|nr:nickel-dependent hydrogenase large subunit [Propionibacteriaceae bacterium]
MIQQVNIGAVIDPAPARVLVKRDTHGEVVEATFDLSGLPRVDSMLIGRKVADVPGLVERLCGICPAAHHLAGIRALEDLAGITQIPHSAAQLRRLLHYGSVMAIHVVSLVATHPHEALLLRRFAKAAMAAAGSPGHFPTTAVPGGVATSLDPGTSQQCLEMAAEALDAATALVMQTMATEVPADPFTGANLALVDDDGLLDLFGAYVRVVDHHGEELISQADHHQWETLVAEAIPGSSSPKPFLRGWGSGAGTYRVGPVAQLRVAPLSTPLADEFRHLWNEQGQGAARARAISILHCVEAIESILLDTQSHQGELVGAGHHERLTRNTGVGWVDGARGLLVHRYVTDHDGLVTDAQILTPTAQNEPWLGALLTHEAASMSDLGFEAAIHEADPCLPCSSAPAGAMGLHVETGQV